MTGEDGQELTTTVEFNLTDWRLENGKYTYRFMVPNIFSAYMVGEVILDGDTDDIEYKYPMVTVNDGQPNRSEMSEDFKVDQTETEAIVGTVDFINHYGPPSTDIDIIKVGPAEDGVIPYLEGAEFNLWMRTDNGEYTIPVPTIIGGDDYAFITNSEGIVTLNIYEDGYYKLEEITAPSGYQIADAAEPIYFRVEDGAVTFSLDGGTSFEAVEDGEPIIEGFATFNIDPDAKSMSITILNTPEQYKLPVTGGIGTVLFKIVGSGVMLGALLSAVMFVKKGRKVRN
jgi:hypothetical protein